MTDKPINRKIPDFNKKAWQFYRTTFAGSYTGLLLTTLASAGQMLLIIPSLLLVKYAFDELIPAKNITYLLITGVVILLLRVLNSLITIAVRKKHIQIINKAIFRLRDTILTRLYSFSRSFFLKNDHRLIHIRIVEDTERLTNMSTALISRLLPSILISVGLLVVLFILNAYLLLIIITLFPLLFFANRYVGRKIKRRVFVFQRAFEHFSKGVSFVLRFMSLTHVQSAQHLEIQRQRLILEELKEKTGSMAIIYAVNAQIQEVLTGLSAIVIIIIGGVAVANQSMSLGEFLSFYLAAIYLNKYINTITTAIPDVITGNESLSTLYDLSAWDEEDPLRGERKIHFSGEMEMQEVSFSYGTAMLLKKINLKIEAGSITAIVGANGSGKTTIMNLLLGFHVPAEGSVTANGVPFAELDMISLRRSIGVVFQHPPLFSGSITDNITYGEEYPDYNQVVRASKYALAHDFIENLPNGYDTQIGEDGVLLSGGECQRIAIARALFREPALLILDEPTNHLDTHAVKEIMNSISTIENKPSILIISHDQSVVNHAENIFRMKDGVLISEKLTYHEKHKKN